MLLLSATPPGGLSEPADAWISRRWEELGLGPPVLLTRKQPDIVGSLSHVVSGTVKDTVPERHKHRLNPSDRGLARGRQLICQFCECAVVAYSLC